MYSRINLCSFWADLSIYNKSVAMLFILGLNCTTTLIISVGSGVSKWFEILHTCYWYRSVRSDLQKSLTIIFGPFM
jgi:hypothetical protein